MPIKVTCPKCQGVLHAPDDAGGKRGKCPTCGTVLSIPAEAPRVGNPGGLPGPDVGYRPPSTGDDIRQSSFGSRPPEPPEVRKAPPARVPAAPAEARKLSDPFARPGSAVATDATARAWRKTRRGLGTVQFAFFLLFLAAIACPVLELVRHFGVALPDQNPGFLGQKDLTATQEIYLGAVLIPLALGILLLTFGRMGAANAPRSSFARGPALLAGFATLFAFLGLLVAAVPTGGQIMSGAMPVVYQGGRLEPMLLPHGEPSGIAQRAGLGLIVLFLPLAEIWFVSALGRMGSGLHSARASGRHTRFLMLFGLVFGLIGTYLVATVVDPAGISWARDWALQKLEYSLMNMGENRVFVQYGVPILISLVVWFAYARVVGGVRRAIREWLDENALA